MIWAVILLGTICMMLCYLVTKPKSTNNTNRTNNHVSKWETDVENYTSLFKQLPEPTVRRLQKAFYNTGMGLGVQPADLPDELTKVVGATTKVIENRQFGSLDNEKNKTINSLINKFENSMVTLVPASKKAMNNAIDNGGLGFGLITNSAANAALYQAMDYRATKKQYAKMNHTVNQLIDRDVLELINGIKKEL